jgi:hypothetical protein
MMARRVRLVIGFQKESQIAEGDFYDTGDEQALTPAIPEDEANDIFAKIFDLINHLGIWSNDDEPRR